MTDAIESAILGARRAMAEEAWGAAWEHLDPFSHELARSARLAEVWAMLVEESGESADRRGELEAILHAWPENPSVVTAAAQAMLRAVDGRTGDDAVPNDDPTHDLVLALRRCIANLDDEEADDPKTAGYLFNTLGTACRLGGLQYDEEAEAAYHSALALDPSRAWWRFNLGLLYKNRGRFAEGLEVYRRVHAAVGDEQPVLWNLGICATAIGDCASAAFAWRRLGLQVDVGEDGLPSMRLPPVKVRLSTARIGVTHPSADEPMFEHVWVERRSPCHGVVLNPTLYDVGGDIGDIVVWDGQPIGVVRDGDLEIPRFPALTWRGGSDVRTFRFAATVPSADALERVRTAVGDDVRVYVFEDEIELLCLDCVRTGGPHEASHRAPPERPPASGLVHGKLVVERGRALLDVIRALEAATQAATVRLAVPQLLEAVGDEVGRRRHELLWSELDGD